MPMSRSAPRGAAVIWRPVRGRYCRATWMGAAAPPPALLHRLPVSQGLLVIGDGQRHPSHLHVRQHALGGHLQVLADGLRPPAPQLLQSRGGHHEACAVDHGGQPQSGFPLVVKAVHHPVVDGVASRDGAVIGIFAVPIALGRPAPARYALFISFRKHRSTTLVRVKDAEGVIVPPGRAAPPQSGAPPPLTGPARCTPAPPPRTVGRPALCYPYSCWGSHRCHTAPPDTPAPAGC